MKEFFENLYYYPIHHSWFISHNFSSNGKVINPAYFQKLPLTWIMLNIFIISIILFALGELILDRDIFNSDISAAQFYQHIGVNYFGAIIISLALQIIYLNVIAIWIGEQNIIAVIVAIGTILSIGLAPYHYYDRPKWFRNRMMILSVIVNGASGLAGIVLVIQHFLSTLLLFLVSLIAFMILGVLFVDREPICECDGHGEDNNADNNNNKIPEKKLPKDGR